MIYKFLNICIALFGLLYCVSAQPNQLDRQNLSLSTGDSLFEQKKYTEALDIYVDLYQEKMSSPAMLLRMSYIYEGLKQEVQALYYLNQYYRLTADRDVLTKIAGLADNKNLSGYEYSDVDYILGFFSKYQLQIVLFLISILALSTVLTWKRQKAELSVIPPVILQVCVLALLFTFGNGLLDKSTGIIQTGNTPLMLGPSAGAEAITLVEKGHKVTILDRDEIWTKISWGERVGYIRNHRILPI
ncbi:MAG: hypothetical protein ACI8QD_001754 [Cyclobacteriaceae bacterium]|jgi:hypothetical protein